MIERTDNTIRVMVTGHRRFSYPSEAENERFGILIRNWLNDQLTSLVTNTDTDVEIEAVSGMALGADTIFANLALLHDTGLVAAIPFRYQCGWKRERKRNGNIRYHRVSNKGYWAMHYAGEYFEILTKAKKIVEVDKVKGYAMPRVEPHIYHPAKFNIRNKWMVDYTLAGKNGVCLAIHSGKPGGTANCVALAKQAGLQVIQYWPTHQELDRLKYNNDVSDIPF